MLYGSTRQDQLFPSGLGLLALELDGCSDPEALASGVGVSILYLSGDDGLLSSLPLRNDEGGGSSLDRERSRGRLGGSSLDRERSLTGSLGRPPPCSTVGDISSSSSVLPGSGGLSRDLDLSLLSGLLLVAGLRGRSLDLDLSLLPLPGIGGTGLSGSQ